MAQEFFINSQSLEDQVRKLLPSQGGLGAGFDLSASTQIVPIIDLTESAEGAGLRQDLQKAMSFNNTTPFTINQGTSTNIITSTGYWKIVFNVSIFANAKCQVKLGDGATVKDVIIYGGGAGTFPQFYSEEMILFTGAGDLIQFRCDTGTQMIGSFRQIADIDGTLSNPT